MRYDPEPPVDDDQFFDEEKTDPYYNNECPVCRGTGEGTADGKACMNCRGSGEIRKSSN